MGPHGCEPVPVHSSAFPSTLTRPLPPLYAVQRLAASCLLSPSGEEPSCFVFSATWIQTDCKRCACFPSPTVCPLVVLPPAPALHPRQRLSASCCQHPACASLPASPCGRPILSLPSAQFHPDRDLRHNQGQRQGPRVAHEARRDRGRRHHHLLLLPGIGAGLRCLWPVRPLQRRLRHRLLEQRQRRVAGHQRADLQRELLTPPPRPPPQLSPSTGSPCTWGRAGCWLLGAGRTGRHSPKGLVDLHLAVPI